MTTTEHTVTVPALDQYGHVAPEQVMKLLAKCANVMGSDQDPVAFADEFMKEHPTLQQSIVTMLLTPILALAQLADAGRGDLRNEAAMGLAKAVRDLLEERGHVFHLSGKRAEAREAEQLIYNGDHIRLPLV